ncbi:MAG: putative Calponin homology domain [Streblomastix strix]|uniref:Putative Calponin homology domain n=1 Tax=Streblomastix strix TaxID=222440 RepID=A0A5J4URQ1_9EUKA|nr:MAG: putative Calponin homology domain [Streblomastix strix]
MAENRYALETDQRNLIYEWVDTVPLSRAKKNISRDFSDTMLYAEVAHHFLPKIVEVHNYPATSTMSKKIDNWNTFLKKVGKKISLILTVQDVDNLANAKPGVIEWALLQLKNAVEAYQAKKAKEKEEKGEVSEEELEQTSGIDTPVKSAKSTQKKSPQQTKEVESKYLRKSGSKKSPHKNEDADSDDDTRRGFDNEHIQLLGQQLREKDQTITDLKSTIELLETKVKKMDQMIKLKDSRIQSLTVKLQQAGLN